jgi:hypothetical protein
MFYCGQEKNKKRDVNFSIFQFIGKLQVIINKTNVLAIENAFQFFSIDFQFSTFSMKGVL